jgi:hypothetical protein
MEFPKHQFEMVQFDQLAKAPIQTKVHTKVRKRLFNRFSDAVDHAMTARSKRGIKCHVIDNSLRATVFRTRP